MKLQTNKKQCIRNLGQANALFRDALRTQELTKKAEKIRTALIILKNMFDDNPQIKCSYKDVLDSEVKYFEENNVPYIDGFTGKITTIPFSEIEEACKKVTYNNPLKKNVRHPKKYTIGNACIGQIFVNGKEAFSIMHAIDHSIYTTLWRWYSISSKLLLFFERMDE